MKARIATTLAAIVAVIALLLTGGAAAPRRVDLLPVRALQCSVAPGESLQLDLEVFVPNVRVGVTLPARFPIWVLHGEDGRPYRAVTPGGLGFGDLFTTEGLDCVGPTAVELETEHRIFTLCAALPGSAPEAFAVSEIPAGRTVELAYDWATEGGTWKRVIDRYSSGQVNVYVKVVDPYATAGSLWVESKQDYDLVTSPAAIERVTQCSCGTRRTHRLEQTWK